VQSDHETRRAIIKPFKLDEVRRRLPPSASTHDRAEVKGYGRQRAIPDLSRRRIHREFPAPSCGSRSPYLPELASQAVAVITSGAPPARSGWQDFVTPIDHALRIRTGETDSDAL